MSRRFVFAVMILASILAAYPLYAGDSDEGTAAAVFLKIGTGARPAAMGGAYSAFARDVNAVYWNPAGLAHVPVRQLSFMHAELLGDQSLEYFAFVQPDFFNGTLGFSFTYVDEGRFDRTTISTTGFAIGNQGTFNASDFAGAVSYGRSLNDMISIGGSLKYVYQAIDSSKGSAIGGDLGLQFKTPLRNLTASFLVQDLGTQIKLDRQGFNLPVQIKGGLAYRAWEGKASLALDVSKPYDNDVTAGLGGEYWVIPNFAVRLGWNSSNEIDNGITVGAGFRYHQLDVDYAFVPYQELGDMHRVSGTYRFGPIRMARHKTASVRDKLSSLRTGHDPRYQPNPPKTLAAPEMHEPQNLQDLYFQALDHFNNEDYGAGRTIIDDVLTRDPAFIPALVLKGQFQITAGHTGDARETFSRVLKIDPGNATARTMMDLLTPGD